MRKNSAHHPVGFVPSSPRPGGDLLLNTVNTRRHARRTSRAPALVMAAVATALIAGGCSAVADHGLSTSTTGPRIGVVGDHGRAKPIRPNKHAKALEVVSVTPAPGSQAVSFTSAIKVEFSEALAPNTPLPRLSGPHIHLS